MTMTDSARSIRDARGDQMFPTLTEEQVERLRRFGEIRQYRDGDPLFRVGETGHGLSVVLTGAIEVSQREKGSQTVIVTHGPGNFLGELAQLSGRPALVDARAVGATEVIDIPPHRLRALLAAEAVIGERIMRALILRRVGLIESGVGGPIIVGESTHEDVLRLENSLTRNGHPHSRLDPARDEEARTLFDRFEVAAGELPIVICPGVVAA